MKKSDVKELIPVVQFRRLTVSLSVVCICVVFLAATVGAQSKKKSAPKQATKDEKECHISEDMPAKTPASELRIPDVQVVDQNGRKVNFYSDLIKGKLVVVNLIYTTCTSICPLHGASFARLQTLLGQRLGKEVYLVSVTIDPATDTPDRLKAWGAKFGAQPGWTLVTGNKGEIEDIVKAFSGELPNRADHSPVAYMINDPKRIRIRAYGLGDSAKWSQLMAELSSVTNDTSRVR